jgi:hypothetical protein
MASPKDTRPANSDNMNIPVEDLPIGQENIAVVLPIDSASGSRRKQDERQRPSDVDRDKGGRKAK